MKQAILLIAGSILITSCASIMTKEDYVYRIESNPPGVEYSITDRGGINVFSGVTPDTVRLPSGQRYFRKQEYTIKLKGPEGDEAQIKSPYDMESWYAGNLLFGWLIGFFIVDPISGAMYKPARQIIDTTFHNKSIKAATVTISESGGKPLTEDDFKKIRESDDMYLGYD